MNKQQIIEEIIKRLTHELTITQTAANNAHLAATDDQSVAETQYDTLAIEASYLAEGQSRRVDELKTSIQLMKQLVPNKFTQESKVSMGALVQLATDVNKKHWFFIAPAAGGFTSTIDNQRYTVITPNAPLAQAFIGKYIDDEIIVTLGNNHINDHIDNIL